MTVTHHLFFSPVWNLWLVAADGLRAQWDDSAYFRTLLWLQSRACALCDCARMLFWACAADARASCVWVVVCEDEEAGRTVSQRGPKNSWARFSLQVGRGRNVSGCVVWVQFALQTLVGSLWIERLAALRQLLLEESSWRDREQSPRETAYNRYMKQCWFLWLRDIVSIWGVIETALALLRWPPARVQGHVSLKLNETVCLCSLIKHPRSFHLQI